MLQENTWIIFFETWFYWLWDIYVNHIHWLAISDMQVMILLTLRHQW